MLPIDPINADQDHVYMQEYWKRCCRKRYSELESDQQAKLNTADRAVVSAETGKQSAQQDLEAAEEHLMDCELKQTQANRASGKFPDKLEVAKQKALKADAAARATLVTAERRKQDASGKLQQAESELRKAVEQQQLVRDRSTTIEQQLQKEFQTALAAFLQEVTK